jgi:hypothetical protein
MAVILYTSKDSGRYGAEHIAGGIECKMIRVDVKSMKKYLTAGYVANVSELVEVKPEIEPETKASKSAQKPASKQESLKLKG